MNTKQPETTDAQLDTLLRGARPDPVAPTDFAHAVWLRIENAAAPADGSWGWLDRLADLLIRPHVALAGLAVVIALSGAVGVVSGGAAARESARQRYVASVTPPMEH